MPQSRTGAFSGATARIELESFSSLPSEVDVRYDPKDPQKVAILFDEAAHLARQEHEENLAVMESLQTFEEQFTPLVEAMRATTLRLNRPGVGRPMVARVAAFEAIDVQLWLAKQTLASESPPDPRDFPLLVGDGTTVVVTMQVQAEERTLTGGFFVIRRSALAKYQVGQRVDIVVDNDNPGLWSLDLARNSDVVLGFTTGC
jgi:hypothetical protein